MERKAIGDSNGESKDGFGNDLQADDVTFPDEAAEMSSKGRLKRCCMRRRLVRIRDIIHLMKMVMIMSRRSPQTLLMLATV